MIRFVGLSAGRLVACERTTLLPLVVVSLLFSALIASCGDAVAQESGEPRVRKPLEGRVEVLEESAVPSLPAELLRASAERQSLPAELEGTWHGDVKVAQMRTFPELHPDNYGQAFIAAISQYVHPDQPGRLTLLFRKERDGGLSLASSDVVLSRGMRKGIRLELDTVRGPALVGDGTNMPHNVVNRVTRLPDGVVEQTRVDDVVIVDPLRRPIRRGYTEVSASYTLVSDRKMNIKLLNIDYNQEGKPLWKVLLKGVARR